MRRFTAVLVLLVLSLGGFSSAAVAAPGSAVDQYEENIPSGAKGDGSKGEGRGDGSKPLGRKQSKSLAKHGEDGRQLEQVLRTASGAPAPAASQTDPADPSGSDDPGEDAAAAATATTPTGTTGTAPARAGERPSEDDAARSSVTAGLASDLGPVPLWVALIVVLVAAVAVGVARRVKA